MKLSVIIPAYRRHEMTTRHVEECLRSTRPPDELIVVNDGGDPCLLGMLKTALLAFPDRSTKVVYALIEEDILWNFNGACNLGFWLSTGDIIAIEDTDHIPDRRLYEDSLALFDGRVERVAPVRKVVLYEHFEKPMGEWPVDSLIGANQMTSLMTRDLYLKLKGQDERFSGGYGYMAYDWHNRYANIYKAVSTKGRYYWAVFGDDGEPGLKRGLSERNRRFYRENSVVGHPQHPAGILNFKYGYETL